LLVGALADFFFFFLQLHFFPSGVSVLLYEFSVYFLFFIFLGWEGGGEMKGTNWERKKPIAVV
jgi:hypothetical protein